MPGTRLPVGAISVARPEDVLNSIINPIPGDRNWGPHLQEPSSVGGIGASSGHNTVGEREDDWPLRSRVQGSEWSSDSASSENTRSEQRKTNRRRRKNGSKRKEPSGGSIPRRDVPMTIFDTRSDLTKLVDGIIENRPTLKALETFEQGSIPDYVDKLGLAREQPSLKFTANSDLTHYYHVRRSRQQDIPTPREAALAEALDLERRRADILEYQVKMFKTELIQAIKRYRVLSAVIDAGQPTGLDGGLQQASEPGARETIDNILSLGTGKVINVLSSEGDRSSGRTTRRGHRKATNGGENSTDMSSSSMSSGSSISWSSSSEDDS